jgi:hypothetical protein
MLNVREMWDQHFTDSKMYDLDVQVNNIDHAWPLFSPKYLPQVGYVAISSWVSFIAGGNQDVPQENH